MISNAVATREEKAWAIACISVWQRRLLKFDTQLNYNCNNDNVPLFACYYNLLHLGLELPTKYLSKGYFC